MRGTKRVAGCRGERRMGRLREMGCVVGMHTRQCERAAGRAVGNAVNCAVFERKAVCANFHNNSALLEAARFSIHYLYETCIYRSTSQFYVSYIARLRMPVGQHCALLNYRCFIGRTTTWIYIL